MGLKINCAASATHLVKEGFVLTNIAPQHVKEHFCMVIKRAALF
jgi:hypothetical protein